MKKFGVVVSATALFFLQGCGPPDSTDHLSDATKKAGAKHSEAKVHFFFSRIKIKFLQNN